MRLMEINIAQVEKEEEKLNLNIVGGSVLQNCQGNELEERSKKAEVRCRELEVELQREKDHCETLKAKVKVLEREKFALEDELRVLKMVSQGLNRPEDVSGEKERGITPIVDLEKDNEAVQEMTEKKVLECQTERAQSEFEVCKDNYKLLDSRALPLEMGNGSFHLEENGKKQEKKQICANENMHLDTSIDFQQNQEKVTDLSNDDSSWVSPSKEIRDMQLEGTPSNGIFHRSSMVLPQKKGIKQLAFETEESPSKKMIPSLPINTKSTPGSVIDISDSDDEPTQDPVPDRQGSGNIFISTSFAAEKGKNSHGSCAQNNEENLDFSEEPLFVANTKRKRTCNVVTSESESDDDDNLPISQLKRTHIQKASADRVAMSEDSSLPAAISEDDKVTDNVKIRRRRLQPLRECLSKIHNDKMSSRRRHRAKHKQSVPANNDQSVEDLSDGEEESTGSFIVDDDDSDVFDCVVTCSKSSRDEFNSDVDSASSNLQDVSDGEMNFGKILSKIQRRKKNAMKWEYQADMLAEFGKDSELCMKAVCSLYKQQTSEEQMSKESMCHNNRGFSKCDAPRGSDLGEFLTEGDPSGGLKKTVEELQEYDTEAVEECRTLAIRYSKQLYDIYKNNEDPFFP